VKCGIGVPKQIQIKIVNSKFDVRDKSELRQLLSGGKTWKKQSSIA